MIRLTWMQFRLPALVGAVGLAVLATVLAITGPSLQHLYATTVLDCHATGRCAGAVSRFLLNDRSLELGLNPLVEAVPALIGIFWGAPLVAREFETGTFRLVWTQTMRTHWTAIKLAIIGLASVAVAGVLSLLVTWWSSPIDAADTAPFTSFDQRDLVPLGYAAFAFAVGVTAGLLIRRTLPAMAASLCVFIAARLAFAHWIRPFLLTPLRVVVPDRNIAEAMSYPINDLAPNPRDWVLSDQTINASGHVIGTLGAIGNGNGAIGVIKNVGVVLGPGYSCPNTTGKPRMQGQLNALVQRCANQLHIREVLLYQPIRNYWPLQWCEFAIFFGTALLFSVFCLWRVRGRLV